MAPKMIIKKLNTMFHKHSRWLFGGFTIVIIISFMGFLTPGQFGCDGFGSGSGMTVGTAFGEKVTLGDLEQIRRENDVLARAGMSMGRDMDYSEAFQRYCLEVAARRQGLAVGDAEVIDFVKKFPVFQENGQYSPARYKEFKENLVRAGGSDELFVEALRGVLLSAKLQNQLGYNRVVTDGELEAFYRRDNVKYDVKTAIFSTDAYLKDVKNDPAAMKAYFDEHAGNYRISGKVAAFLVEFPNARYLKEAEAKATDAEVKKFFDTRPQLFVKLAKDGKMPEFEACKKEAKAEFIKAACRDLAMRHAYEFAAAAYDAVSEAGDGRAEVFRKLAAKEKAEVVDTGLVDFNAPAIGKISSPELLQNLIAAFDNHWVTNPVAAGESVFVGLARERIPEKAATFNEVSAQVAADYRNAEATRLATEAAAKAEESLAAIEDGAARLKAFNELKGCTIREFRFSPAGEFPPMELFPSAGAAMRLNVDEVSKVLPAEGGPQLAILLKRTPADMKDFESKKEQLRSSLGNMKRELSIGVFEEEFMTQCQLDPKLVQR